MQKISRDATTVRRISVFKELAVSSNPKSSSAIFFADDPSTMTLLPQYKGARALMGECESTTIERWTSTWSLSESSFALAASVHPEVRRRQAVVVSIDRMIKRRRKLQINSAQDRAAPVISKKLSGKWRVQGGGGG